jgi:hypothetical protein
MRLSSTTLHALQIRAFLDASEDVGIDPETVEDILDGFESSSHQGDADSDDEDPIADLGSDDILDISALYTTDLGGESTQQYTLNMCHSILTRHV